MIRFLLMARFMRKIIHIDMDAFFASVEQRDNPALRGKPVIVGGDPDGRGVVAAASYEARRFGIHSAMRCSQARQLCRHAIFVRPRFDVYRAVSRQVQALMHAITPLVEPVSLDEAYLDVSAVWQDFGSATALAERLRADIHRTTGLTASAGVSHNKMLAKIASDINKPNGITVIPPEHAQALIDSLPIERFHGIGRASSARLHEIDIHSGRSLRMMPLEKLVEMFGNKRGRYYHDIAHGIDERIVNAKRIRKSIGTEITFGENTQDDAVILSTIHKQTYDAFTILTERKLTAHTVTLKLKFANFTQITRSHSQKQAYSSAEQAYEWLTALFSDVDRTLAIRLVGVTFSNFGDQNDAQQLSLFE